MNTQASEVKREVEQQAPPAEQASCCAAQSQARSWRWWLIGGAVLALPLALYAGWDWLAATGFASVLVAAAPCLVMCALGLCMGRGKSKSETPVRDVKKT